MSIIISIIKIVLNIIYSLLKLLKIKNKITIISRQSNKRTQDLEILYQELKNDLKDYQIVSLTKKIEPGIINKIKYCFHMLVQMYHIATSKVVLLDSYCIVISLLKHKKSLKVIQMWHGIGTMKKSGYSILDKEEGRSSKIAKLLNMHKNYDYIFCSSEACRKDSAELFNYDIEKVLVYPLPRVSLLQDKKYQKDKIKEIYIEYPEISKKKNIVYIPTYRKNNDELEEAIDNLIKEIDYNKYNLILKLHPLTAYSLKDNRAILDKKFTSTEMLFVADYVIADYSTTLFESAILNKPMYFYTYDKDKYIKRRNFYIDYDKEMPGVISKNAKDIIKEIENNSYNLNKIKKFKEKYVEINGNPTKNIVSFIKTLL